MWCPFSSGVLHCWAAGTAARPVPIEEDSRGCSETVLSLTQQSWDGSFLGDLPLILPPSCGDERPLLPGLDCLDLVLVGVETLTVLSYRPTISAAEFL